MSGRCLSIMYHYVRDRSEGLDSGVVGLAANEFAAQLDLLCEVLTPIDWPTFTAWRAGRTAIDGDTFLLTFDDGLSDHADVVAPILEARGLRGVFFVQSQVLVQPVMAAAHEIHLLLSALAPAQFSRAIRMWLERNGVRNRYPVDQSAAQCLYHYESPDRARLKYLLTIVLPIELRDRMIDELFMEHVGDPAAVARRWYMDWEQLGALQRAGHTIGGHGHRHVPLARLTPSEQASDMGRCAALLRDGLGPAARPFSYPYGSHDESVAHRCAASGFANGFTTREGWIGATDDPHRLCRVDTIHVDAFLEKEFPCQQV